MFLFPRFQTCFLFVFFLLYLQDYTAMAANPTKNCHCFKERTFNPAKKFSSDNYILTTTTNSFISLYFDFDKKNIILMKMGQGVSSEDVLIGLYVAARTGNDIHVLINLREQGLDWKSILTRSEFTDAVEKNPVLTRMATNLNPQDSSRFITDHLLSRFFSVKSETLQSLRNRNLNSKEITLLLTLSAKSSIGVDQLADFVHKQGLSYSEIAYNLGFQPTEMKTVLRELDRSFANRL